MPADWWSCAACRLGWVNEPGQLKCPKHGVHGTVPCLTFRGFIIFVLKFHSVASIFLTLVMS